MRPHGWTATVAFPRTWPCIDPNSLSAIKGDIRPDTHSTHGVPASPKITRRFPRFLRLFFFPTPPRAASQPPNEGSRVKRAHPPHLSFRKAEEKNTVYLYVLSCLLYVSGKRSTAIVQSLWCITSKVVRRYLSSLVISGFSASFLTSFANWGSCHSSSRLYRIPDVGSPSISSLLRNPKAAAS